MSKLSTIPGFNAAELKQLFDAVGAATMMIEKRSGNLVYGFLNSEAEHYFGISTEQYSGKKIEPYKGDDEARRERRRRTIEGYSACFDTGQVVILEVEHVHPKHGTRWGRHTIAPFGVESGGVVRQILVTSIDVTDLVATQKRLDQALTRTLSEFVTICAECKDIKSDDRWVSIEEYASKKMDYRSFSHGVCPTCMVRHLD